MLFVRELTGCRDERGLLFRNGDFLRFLAPCTYHVLLWKSVGHVKPKGIDAAERRVVAHEIERVYGARDGVLDELLRIRL